MTLVISKAEYYFYRYCRRRHRRLPRSPNMSSLSHILSANAQWAKDVEQTEPGFFATSAKGQTPKVRFITLFFDLAGARVENCLGFLFRFCG
jgi:hypothetical protein